MNERLRTRVIPLCLVAVLVLVVVTTASAQEVKLPIVEALGAGDTARAMELLQREIELDPGYHMNYYVLGTIYFDRMQCARAKQQFQLALEKKSKHYESVYQLGLCHLALDQLDSAQALMEQGRKKAKKGLRHAFENGYGLVMLKRGECVEADRAFRQALVDNPDNPEYLINLGDANFCQGVPSLAATYYQKALELDTGSTEVYYHWAEACIEMRDYSCAIEKLRVVLRRDSTYANAWMRAGGIYYKAALSTPTRNERNARFKDAIGSYKRYLELSGAQPDSSNVRVLFELAMSYLNLYGFEDAVKYFESVVSIPMEPRDIYFYYGKALWGIQQYVKSGEILLRHLEWVERHEDENHTRVSDVELYQLLGDSYFYRKPKDYATAVRYYLKSLEEDPNQKRIVQNVAFGYHTMKSYQQAIEYYDKRIELGIDSSTASILKNAGYCALNIANAAAAAGDDEMLNDEMDEFGEESGSPGGVDLNMIDPNINYYEEAARYLTGYLEYEPDDTGVVSMVANTYLYQLSDCESGVKYYERVLTLDPKNCEALKALGFAYFGGVCTKNYARAANYLRQAYDCISASKGACADVNLLLWLGQCYHLRAADRAEAKEDASSDFRSAYEWYEKCLKCDAGNAECKKGRDEVYLEFGD